MNIFEQNLLALKQTDETLYKKLKQIQTNETFEVFMSDNPENANILDIFNKNPIYMEEPISQINNKIEEFKKHSRHKTLYFFGIGNGYFYKKLLKNKIHTALYIFEPEIELIYIALNLVDLSKEIKDGKIQIHLSKNVDYLYMLNILTEQDKLYFKAYDLHIHSPYYERYNDEISTINQSIIKVFTHHVNIIGNDCIDELTGFKHFLSNIPLMIQNPTLAELAQKMNTKTAVIVATGPSLAKQLPLLKKIQDYVTIISVDASFPILEKNGIKPDIVTSIERIALTAKFYEKTPDYFHKDVIFALTSVVHKELLDEVKGDVQINMRPTGKYYYYMELDDWGYIGVGMSAANLAYELAARANFEQIVLIGQDLAYGKEGESHSKNHIFGENEVNIEKEEGYIKAYGGDGEVKTTWAWKLFLEGYEKVIAHYNNTNVKTINATEGGAHIQGTEEISFKDVIKLYVDTKKKKEKITLNRPSSELYEQLLNQSIEKLNNTLYVGESMQKQAKKLLTLITDMINKNKHHDIKTLSKHIKQKDINNIINKIGQIREKYYLKSFYDVYESLLGPLITHVEFEIASISTLPEMNEQDIFEKRWKTIVIHHEWLLRVLINLEPIIKIIKDAKVNMQEKTLEEA